MADQSNDPLALWQKMIGEMEKGFNAFANQAMASPQFSKAINQAGGVTAGPKKHRRELLEKKLLRQTMPPRAPMVGTAAPPRPFQPPFTPTTTPPPPPHTTPPHTPNTR